MDKDYQTSRKLFQVIPLKKGIFDKALLGRINAKKTLNKDERTIAKSIPPQSGNKTYPMERALTNPLVAGVVGGAFSVGMAALKPKYMGYAFKQYEKNKASTNVIDKAMSSFFKHRLIDPKEFKVMETAERVKEVYTPKAQQLVNRGLVMGGVYAGGTALARRLHPRALMGEIVQEHKKVRQRDPSEYIRTKLRDDVELKRQSHAMIKQSQEKSIMDETVRKLIGGVSKVAMDMSGMVEGAKGVASTVGRFAKGQALNAIGKGEVGAMRNIGPNVERINNAGRAMKAQAKGIGIVGGTAGAVGLGAKAVMGRNQEKEAAKMSKEEFMEKFKKKKETKAEEKKEKTAGLLPALGGLASGVIKAAKPLTEVISPLNDAATLVSSVKKLTTQAK